MKQIMLAILTTAGLAGSVAAQDLTPIGTVQFRWRERALGVTSSTTLAPGATAAAANSVANPTLTTDAIYHLVLEAFVTNTAQANQCRGFGAGSFDIISNETRSNSIFAGSSAIGIPPGSSSTPPDIRNRSSPTAAASGLTLPAGATMLPNEPSSNNNGIFAPFRAVVDIGGSFNGHLIGSQNESTVGPKSLVATMEHIVPGLNDGGAFSQGPSFDPESGEPLPAGPYFQQYQYSGLNAWVPLFYVVLDVMNVTDARTISVNAVVNLVTPGDSGLRGWRGVSNGAVGDKWQITLAGQLPTFSITVPAPAAAAVLGLGCVVATRRRRD